MIIDQILFSNSLTKGTAFNSCNSITINSITAKNLIYNQFKTQNDIIYPFFSFVNINNLDISTIDYEGP